MKVGRLALRVAVGSLFVGHGTQKLFGWFGGGGLSATAANMESMGLRPAKAQATAAGLAESGGGAALALGYRTPFASAALISVMLSAIKRVHFKNGPWSHNGGYEYNLVLIAAAITLAEAGPGGLSLDALRGKQHKGFQWGLLALALGAAGAAGANVIADRQAAKHTEPTSPYGAAADATPAVSAVDPAPTTPVEHVVAAAAGAAAAQSAPAGSLADSDAAATDHADEVAASAEEVSDTES